MRILLLALCSCLGWFLAAQPGDKFFLTDDALPHHRSRVSTDTGILALTHAALLNAATDMLDLPPEPRKMKGRRLLGTSRLVLKRVLYLGYAYRLTGERRYARRAIEEMLMVADYADWNPSHFLDVAELSAALGIGYNWLYAELTEEQRTRVRAAILEKAIQPSYDEQYNWFLNAHHNWNQVCNTGIALGALTLRDTLPELVEQTLLRSGQSLQNTYVQYAPDGAYAEGPGYYDYGNTYHCMFLDGLEGRLADSLLRVPDYFLAGAGFLLHTRGPVSTYNYADNTDGDKVNTGVFYLAARRGTAAPLYYQVPALRHHLTTGRVRAGDTKHRFLPLLLIWAARLDDLTPTPPDRLSWTGLGLNPVSMHRTSFSDTATYVGIKGGRPYVNHGHMDIGSFVLDHGGQRWVLDPGRHDYHTLESAGHNIWDREEGGHRWEVNRYHVRTHSTLMVNGRGQAVYPYAPLRALANERGAVVDMDSTYAHGLARARRGLRMHPNGQVVVTDTVVAPIDTAAKVRWAVLTVDSVRIDGGQAVLYQNGQEMAVRVTSPTDAQLVTYSSQPTHPVEQPLPGTLMLGFEHRLRAGEEAVLRVVFEPR